MNDEKNITIMKYKTFLWAGASVLLLAGICIAGCLGSDHPGNWTPPTPGITSGNEIPLFVTLDPVGCTEAETPSRLPGQSNLPEDLATSALISMRNFCPRNLQ